MANKLEKKLTDHMALPAIEASLLGVLYDINSPVKRVRRQSRNLARHYLKVIRRKDPAKYHQYKKLYERTLKENGYIAQQR